MEKRKVLIEEGRLKEQRHSATRHEQQKMSTTNFQGAWLEKPKRCVKDRKGEEGKKERKCSSLPTAAVMDGRAGRKAEGGSRRVAAPSFNNSRWGRRNEQKINAARSSSPLFFAFVTKTTTA